MIGEIHKYNLFAGWVIRLKRLTKHVVYPIFKSKRNPFPSAGIIEWLIDFWFYFMDALLFPELYQFVQRLFFRNIRRMNDHEIDLAVSIFGSAIDYNRVFINNKAWLINPKYALAYVTFNTINYREDISNPIFIHEMTHIWQYQHFGSIYIAKALKAQRSTAGYDYGGTEGLYQAFQSGKALTDFNFEQQAEIIEDFYRSSLDTNQASPMQAMVYGYYHQQLEA